MIALQIKPATSADFDDVRLAIIELQEHERCLHSSRRPGNEIAGQYLEWIVSQVGHNGAFLVARIGSSFVGFVAGWIEEEATISETLDSRRYAYVSDIYVVPPFRSRGVARQMLASIESRLAIHRVTRLRIASLAANTEAEKAYQRAGFSAYEIVYEKRISVPKVCIRGEKRSDFAAIRELTQAAFADMPEAEGDEHDFVERLRSTDAYIPALALVGEERNTDETPIVGHVMLTKFDIAGAPQSSRVLLLAILSVSPVRQRQGLGSQLLQDALARARALKFQVAFVLGDPAYYMRFGFLPSATFGITNSNGYPRENAMALNLGSGSLAGMEGVVTFPT